MTEKPSKKIENLNDKVKRLQEEISGLQTEMSRCDHKYGEPTEIQIPYYEAHYSHLEGQGSDPWPVYNYSTRYKTGWKRECEKCGFTETTEESEPIIKGYKPKFRE